ncbi:MAG: hypothetical protein ONB44_20605 [candidate division KSB1 bacterium]|nr:hypothetical protein [candidate division KSB1 bacterium]MDZ7313702.1 hypothetical protein [candidate division KSB1 bacterium]
MDYIEYASGRFATDIAAVAKQYDLNLDHLEIEFFNPGRQAICVETIGGRSFRVHLNLEENRIIAVQQIAGEAGESSGEDFFAKYKNFMK